MNIGCRYLTDRDLTVLKMGRGKAQVKPRGGGRGHGVRKVKKVDEAGFKMKTKKSVLAMLVKAKAKPYATLLTQGHLQVGDSVEVKEAGVVHECRVVKVGRTWCRSTISAGTQGMIPGFTTQAQEGKHSGTAQIGPWKILCQILL